MAIRILDLSGSPEQIGSAHGETLRTDIQRCLAIWLDDLGSTDASWPGTVTEDFMARTALRGTAERLAPDLCSEFDAIARAAEVDPRLLWAWNHLDEVSWFLLARDGGSPMSSATSCSSIGIAGRDGAPPIVAQNMDLMDFNTWDPVVLRLHPDGGARTLVLANPGVLAQCGCNAHGVAVCCNQLLALRTSDAGLPVTFIVRRILAQPDLASVKRFVHAVPHASGQNFLVGTPGGMVDFECSAGEVAEIGEGDPIIVHTNHPLANGDLSSLGWKAQNSYDRQRFLEERLGPDAGRTDIEAALSDRTTPVCKVGGSGSYGNTYASIVMRLEAAEPQVWLTSGPPTEGSFDAVPFEAS